MQSLSASRFDNRVGEFQVATGGGNWVAIRDRVTVTPDGLYELNGQAFKSLSAAARHITGTRWNGPKFFGLRDGKGDSQ